jgi:predicted Zn-dependent protease
MGERLAMVCDRQDLTYRFKVLKGTNKKTDYNAFALPGGYIYIFDYLAQEQRTDDAIAAVLSHELAHVAAKHSIQRLQTGIGMNAIMLLALGLSRDGRTMAEAGSALNQLMLSYSREAEVEADRISVKYLKKAGYDPDGIIQSLEFMKNFRKKGPVFPYIFDKTHPYLSERLAHARVAVNGRSDFTSYINLPDPDREYY